MIAPLMFQTMSALLHLGKSIKSGNLGIECFQPFLKVSVYYTFPSLVLVSLILSKPLVENVTFDTDF